MSLNLKIICRVLSLSSVSVSFIILFSLPDCLEMRYVFSITFFMINGIIQAQKLVSQVYYLDQCQKYNTIKKEAPTTSTILS